MPQSGPSEVEGPAGNKVYGSKNEGDEDDQRGLEVCLSVRFDRILIFY